MALIEPHLIWIQNPFQDQSYASWIFHSEGQLAISATLSILRNEGQP